MGIQRRGLHEIALCTERSVHLVGGNLDVFLSFLPGLGRSVVPGFLRTLKQIHGSQNIGLHEDLGIRDGTVYMALRRKVDHIVKVVFFEQAADQLFIADISLNKYMAGIALDALQVFKISGIGQLVKVDKKNVVILFQHVVNKVGADKAGAACDQIFFHVVFNPFFYSQYVSIQHPCLLVPNSSVELAHKGNLVLADGAGKALSASVRPQPGMQSIPGFRVLNSYLNISACRRQPPEDALHRGSFHTSWQIFSDLRHRSSR